MEAGPDSGVDEPTAAPRDNSLSRITPTGFLASYLYHCGETEVPLEFHLWAGISMVAAAVGDRVWVEKFAGKKLFPNLYVLLLGTSASGKDSAINQAVGLASPSTRERMALYLGMATAPALARWMSKQRKTIRKDDPLAAAHLELRPPGRLFYVTPELALSVRSGGIAEDFVRLFTGLYSPTAAPFQVSTVSHGHVTIRPSTINWLSGTTKEWLVKSVPRDAIEGGFFGRVAVIKGGRSFDRRITEPTFPPDVGECRVELVRQLEILVTRVEGAIPMSEAARAIDDQWYQTRPPPGNEQLHPGWWRQQDLVYKLSAVVALSEWVERMSGHLAGERSAPVLQIASRHIVQGQRLVFGAHAATPEILAAASTSPAVAAINTAAAAVKRAGRLQHKQLVRHMSSRGFSGLVANQAVSDLLEQGLAKTEDVASGNGTGSGRWYVWVG